MPWALIGIGIQAGGLPALAGLPVFKQGGLDSVHQVTVHGSDCGIKQPSDPADRQLLAPTLQLLQGGVGGNRGRGERTELPHPPPSPLPSSMHDLEF